MKRPTEAQLTTVLRTEVASKIAEANARIRLHDALGRVLQKWDRKRIMRRVMAQFREEAGLGETTISTWNTEYGVRIDVWGGSTPWRSYDEGPRFEICNEPSQKPPFADPFCFEFWEAHDARNGANARKWVDNASAWMADLMNAEYVAWQIALWWKASDRLIEAAVASPIEYAVKDIAKRSRPVGTP